ncbi:hypothetical protein J6590_038353 [Homalodisca vitripennis]|nr:hypothetical protein J6590_038353 [Homalodisca vitripennis]
MTTTTRASIPTPSQEKRPCCNHSRKNQNQDRNKRITTNQPKDDGADNFGTPATGPWLAGLAWIISHFYCPKLENSTRPLKPPTARVKMAELSNAINTLPKKSSGKTTPSIKLQGKAGKRPFLMPPRMLEQLYAVMHMLHSLTSLLSNQAIQTDVGRQE